MLIKPSKLVFFVFLIIGSLVPALAVAEVMVRFDTGFFGTVGKNTQKANGISLMSNYDIDLIEVSQDLGDGATVFQVTESSQIQGNDIPVDLIIHQGASKTTLEGTITWLWQPGGTVIMLGFVSNAGVEATITETNPDSGQAPRVYLVDGNFDDSNDLERGESGDTNIGLIFRGQTGHTFVDNENISGSANLNAVIDALNDYLADPVSQPANPALGITKTGTLNDDDGTTGLSAGDTISYAFTVTNTGNTTLTNIEVTDPKATVTGTTIASLASGASDTTSYTASYTLLQADIDAGTFTNTATATGDGAGTDDVTDTDSDTQTLARTGSLTLIKTASDPADSDSNGVDVGDVITYTYVTTNSGNVTLTNVVVAETQADFTGTGTLPSPLYASGGSDQDSDSATDDLAVGESVTWTATYALTQADINAGFVENQAKATGSSPGNTGDATDLSDDDGTNDSDKTKKSYSPVSNQTLAKVVTSKTGTAGAYAVGDVVTYTITQTNTGNVTLNNVVITDDKVTKSTTSGETGSCTSVAPSATCILVGTYTITQTEKDAGTFKNTASVKSTEIPTALEASNTITLASNAKPTLSKALTSNADEDKTSTITVGDTLTYTVTLLNDGDVTITDTTITDDKISPSSASCSSVAVNGTCVLTGTYKVTQADVDAGKVTNNAESTSKNPAGTTLTRQASNEEAITQSAAQTLTKVVTSKTGTAGSLCGG